MKAAPLLLLLGVAACAGPRPQTPAAAALSPPAQWRTAGASVTRVDPKWWTTFGDQGLSDIVERALADNDDIAIAANRVEAARARFQLAQAQRLPDLFASASGGRERQVNAFGQDVFQTAGQAGVAISYDLDLFGRLRTASAAAKAGLLATQAARDGVKLAVASEAARGYLALLSLDAQLAVARKTLATRDASLQFVARQVKAGYAAELVQRQAEAEYRATEQLVPALELAIHQTEDGLSLLLGQAPGGIARGRSLDALATPPAVAVLPSSLLRRRPDIVQAEQELVAADRSLDSVRAAFLPTVQLNGTGGYVASTLLASNPLSVFSIGGGILQSIFDGGRLRAEQKGAAAARDAAAFGYRRVALNAFRETEDALASVGLLGEKETVIQSEHEALARLLTLAQNRYRAGYSSYLEQIDAERGLLQADLGLVQIRAQRLQAFVTLYQALGGGWSEDELARAGH